MRTNHVAFASFGENTVLAGGWGEGGRGGGMQAKMHPIGFWLIFYLTLFEYPCTHVGVVCVRIVWRPWNTAWQQMSSSLQVRDLWQVKDLFSVCRHVKRAYMAANGSVNTQWPGMWENMQAGSEHLNWGEMWSTLVSNYCIWERIMEVTHKLYICILFMNESSIYLLTHLSGLVPYIGRETSISMLSAELNVVL